MTETTAEPTTRRWRPRSSGVSLATRLAGALLALSLVSLAVATIVGVSAGFDLGRDIYEQRLEAAADAGAFDVAAALNGTTAAAEALAISPEASVAIDAFAAALDELRVDPTIDTDVITTDLVAAYDEPYLTSSGDGGQSLAISEVVPRDPGALYLQNEYSVQTVDAETGEPITGEPTIGQQTEVRVVDDASRLEDAGDGSTWSAVHDEYHSAYRRVVEEFNLLDLYLVEPDDAVVVYSVGKAPDLGTSLISGPMGGSVLANTVKAVIEDPTTARSDLQTYVAASGEIIGVVAAPVFDGDQLAGVIAITYAGERIDALLDRPAADGGNTPDVFLAGTTGTLRSNPRSFREDPATYLDQSEASGSITAAERQEIVDAGSVALIQTVSAATAESAVRGDTGVERRPSVTGEEVFGTVQQVPIESPLWFVVGELDFDDAEAALADFRSILIVGTSLFVIAIAFFAVGWARRIVQPVKLISERLGDLGSTKEPLEIPPQSPIEMHRLVESFESMAATLDQQQVSLALAREERLDLMKQMLPTAVADRVVSGELDGVDEVAHATVVVAVVLGLGDLVRRGGPSRRGLVDRLHSELDDLAEHHGLDRIKVVGDAYFASCGHDRPFIDHAPRVVAFATDARDAVRSIGAEQGDALAIGAGVQTGPVTVGMTGGARLVYDVWGETVTAAHHLARQAGPDVILVAEPVKALLPDEVLITPVGDDDVWAVGDVTEGSRA